MSRHRVDATPAELRAARTATLAALADAAACRAPHARGELAALRAADTLGPLAARIGAVLHAVRPGPEAAITLLEETCGVDPAHDRAHLSAHDPHPMWLCAACAARDSAHWPVRTIPAPGRTTCAWWWGPAGNEFAGALALVRSGIGRRLATRYPPPPGWPEVWGAHTASPPPCPGSPPMVSMASSSSPSACTTWGAINSSAPPPRSSRARQ